MPAPALESAQAALQGVQVLRTRNRGRDEWEGGGRVEWRRVEEGSYTSAAGSSATNEVYRDVGGIEGFISALL